MLKEKRWCLLKRPENLTDSQRLSLRELLGYNLRSVRAYFLKEQFQQCWDYDSATWSGEFLDRWCTQSMRSRIEPVKKFARTLRTHRVLLLNYFRARKKFSSGIVEGLNNKAKVPMRKVYGYRSLDIARISRCVTCSASFPSLNSPTNSSDEAKFLNRLCRAVPAAMLRAGCVALSSFVSACGGGGDGVLPSSAAATPELITAPNPAPGTTPPPPVSALSIDSSASGNPVSSRVALSAEGNAFAVWRAHDGTRHNLWASCYRAATAAWGHPVNIEASNADIDDFDLTVDARGSAVVAWHEVPTGDPVREQGVVMSTRFDAGAGTWVTPVLLSTNGRGPRVASNATGAVLAVYVQGGFLVRGRFFDPASGTWQGEDAIEQNTTGTGYSRDPEALLDGSGNALVAWPYARTGMSVVSGNYFSRSGGDWGRLPPGQIFGMLDGVPGSFTQGILANVRLATTTDGNFLVAWQATQSFEHPEGATIFASRFTGRTRTWSAAQSLVSGRGQNIQFQRIGSDAGGRALLLWTEDNGTRTALKAIRVDEAGAACSAAQVIDSAIAGGAARADLGVDPQGNAIAIWQQFEGGRPDDGSRSNIAINRFDGAAGTWAGAVLAETQPGNAISPRASASGGQGLLGWIQSEGGVNRVKVVLQPLAATPRR